MGHLLLKRTNRKHYQVRRRRKEKAKEEQREAFTTWNIKALKELISSKGEVDRQNPEETPKVLTIRQLKRVASRLQ